MFGKAFLGDPQDFFAERYEASEQPLTQSSTCVEFYARVRREKQRGRERERERERNTLVNVNVVCIGNLLLGLFI